MGTPKGFNEQQKVRENMGHKNSYSRNLNEQVVDILKPMITRGFGTSKADAKADGSIEAKIFTGKTYEVYKTHGEYFAAWLLENHPDVRSLKHSGAQYVPEYLAYYEAKTDSASSVTTARSALNKMFGIKVGDELFYQCAPRSRADYKRSRRDDTESRTKFSELNNSAIVHFCKATGCRRGVLERLTGADYVTRAELVATEKALSAKSELTEKESRMLSAIRDALTYFPQSVEFLRHAGDKGGKTRFAPFVGKYADEAAARVRDTPADKKVWLAVPRKMDVHGYRADYAATVYRDNAREISEIPFDKINKGTGKRYQSDVYVCRGDRAGEKMDKRAMLIASKALGHNRLDVVAQSYSRGI